MNKLRRIVSKALIGMDPEEFRQLFEKAAIARGEDEFFERAYGRFMIAWSDAEAELYRVLCHYAEVSDAVARAIFSGCRARIMMNYIEGIIHNRDNIIQARIDDLKHVFPQIAAINTMRDMLAHYLSDSYAFTNDPKERVVTDKLRAARYGKDRIIVIGVKTLDNMTSDLHAIQNHLNMHWGKRASPFVPWRENDQNDPPTTWLYKSPQPEGKKGKKPSIPQRREDPRQSSRE